MQSKRKVLLFLQQGVGGAERMTVLIGKYLDSTKYDVKFVLICTTDKLLNNIEDFIPNEFKKIYLNYNSPLELVKFIFKMIKQETPDIVFSSVININNKLLSIRILFPRIKFIIRCDNYLYTYTLKQRIILGVLYRLADAIIVQTDEMKEELLGIKFSERKIAVIENPVDKEFIDSQTDMCLTPYPADGKKHMIASGRFAYQKGFDLLIKAFRLVKDIRNDVDLYIIGNNEGLEALEYKKIFHLVQKLHLQESVHCLGFQKNPYVYVKYADCFVLSSRWEGLPNALLESLYLGTPVAAFKCIPIIDRIVIDGVNGFKAEKDDVSSLANAILHTLNLDRVKNDYLGSEAKDFIKVFTI